MSSSEPVRRDEVVGGLPANRAAALLFLIESRTAQLVDRACDAMVPFCTETAARERDVASIEAVALGREPPVHPSIHDLERYAPQWADLVPADEELRAAVAHLLSKRYEVTAAATPALRAALGLDETAVRKAYQRLYRNPLAMIYATRPSPSTRLRWTLARLGIWLESRPPFWTAFALTLTETIGAGLLALPIALAGIGPLPGIILLVVLGAVNVITIAWLAEAFARTASVRYGGAYFGRLVSDYLGSAGALLLTLALVTICVVVTLGYALGLSTTLASVTGVAAPLWMLLHFLIVGYVVSRDSLNSTVASALGIGALNLVMVLILAVLAFPHVNVVNLRHVQVPGFGGQPFEPALLGLIFGVILVAYFGHTSVGNCAAVVLQHDASGRALIWGTVAAQTLAILIYAGWVLAINGAIAPDVLAGQTGTSLVPLADVAGPAVYVFGSVFAVLAMGLGSIHMTLALVNVVRERLPKWSEQVVLLPRHHGRLIFEPRGKAGRGPRLTLSFHGLVNRQPRLHLGVHAGEHTQRVDQTGVGLWTVRDALDRLPDAVRDTLDLTVQVLDAGKDQVRLRITTGMSMHFEGAWVATGLDHVGLLDIAEPGPAPDRDGSLLRRMLRRGEVGPTDVVRWTRSASPTWRGRSSPLAAPRTGGRRALAYLLDGRGRLIIELSPPFLVFLLAEWLVVGDRASFTEVLNVAGIIAVPIFSGLFPSLLLVASRRKGELVPGVVSQLLGRRWLTLGVYGVFLTAILLHGLVIWQQPLQRIAALVSGIAALVISTIAVHRGAFDSRTVVTLREDLRDGDGTHVAFVSAGHPVAVDLRVDGAEGDRVIHASTVAERDSAALRHISADLETEGTRDLKVWAHRIRPDGKAESLPSHVRLTCGTDEREADLHLAGGQVLLPYRGASCSVEITLAEPSFAAAAPLN